MSARDLEAALTDYLTMRRALGFKLARAEKLLRQFIAYLDEAGAETITTRHALAWASAPPSAHPGWHAQRLSVVRAFARHLRALDGRAEVPAADLLRSQSARATPYLYSEAEIGALIAATAVLRSELSQLTYATLIGLLAATGIRIGEALGLDCADVDLERGLIVVRHGKLGKARELVLHPSSIDAMRAYLRERERLAPASSGPALFVSAAGTRILYCNFHARWRCIVEAAGLRRRSAHCRPRPHDVRHSFAVRTMIDAYRSGADGARALTLLSTYLGHSKPADTYWYLSASPELLGLAAERLEPPIGGRS